MPRKADLLPLPIALAIGLLLASLLVSLPTIPVKADPGWEIEIVDDSGSYGWAYHTSLALDSNGYPHISYSYMSTWDNYDLKYASYNGTDWNIETVDDDGTWLGDTSLALDTNGYPHISYWDSDKSDLKYASYNGTDWNIETVATDRDGQCSSIALDAGDHPHISYTHVGHSPTNILNLRYASYNGTDWNIETVDDSDNVGYMTSLALDTTGYPHISYTDYPNGALKYASYNGTAWNLQTVDGNNVRWAWHTSLALDATDYPHISYYDRNWDNYDLKYASYNGTDWNIPTVVDSVGDYSYYTSLALDTYGYPHISYYDGGNSDLKYASYDGTAWNIQTVTSDGGSNSSLALDSCDYPHISYMGSLKYASFIPAPGLAVSKGGSAVSKVGDNVTYWVNISNTGDVPLQKVSVTDSLVPGIDSMFSAQLNVGASENRTYSHIVDGGDPNPLLNTVTAVYGDAYGGACFSNLSVSDNHSVTLVHPGIAVTKTPVNPISKVGDEVTFTITIDNTGDCTLVRSSISDNLSVSPDPDTYASFDSIPASSSVSGNFTYTVQDTDPDPLVNTVTVHYHPQGLPNDITDNATCYVDLRHPDILVTKGVATGTYGVGDNITYTLSINNTSTDITLIKDSVTDSLVGDITSLFSDNITVGGSDNQTYIYTIKSTDPDPLINDITVHYHPQGLLNDITDSTYASVFLAPTITSVTPNEDYLSQTLDVVITGSQLNRVNAVDFGTGITVNSITVDGPTQITVNISIDANAASGPRDVTVTNPTGSDILIDGFTVQQSGATTPSQTTGRRSSPSIYTSPGMSGPAQIQLQYLSIRPQQTTAGQPVTITTNVVNTGDEAGSYNVALKINGHMEQSHMVSVSPQGTQPVKFTVTRSQPGTYTVNIDEQRGSFIVTGAGSSPNGQMGEGILFIAAIAVIAILVVLLITVTKRRFQDY